MENGLRRIIRSNIHATSAQSACEEIVQWGLEQKSCYVLPGNVSVVMTAFWRKRYQQIINNATLVIPDSQFLVWALRLLGVKQQQKVIISDLMLACCDRAQASQIPIYFYGATPLILAKLEHLLKQWYPHLMIVGSHAPSANTTQELEAELNVIKKSAASLIFVALKSPQQEQWMAKQVNHLPATMVGVGSTLATLTGDLSPPPKWISQLKLQRFYYLLTNSHPFGGAYLINHLTFVVFFSLQFLQHRFLLLLGLKKKRSISNQ